MESGASVLEDKASTRGNDATAEGVGYAVDEGAGVAGEIGDGEVDRVAGFVGGRAGVEVGGRSARVEECGSLSEVFLGDEGFG